MRSSEEKLWAMSGYILFFLPLLKPKNEFLRFTLIRAWFCGSAIFF